MTAPTPAAPRAQTYLITGVAGFIAARTAEMLLAAGHTVVGVDNLNGYYDVRLKEHRLDRLLGGHGSQTGAVATEHPTGVLGTSRSTEAAGGERTFGAFTFLPLDIEDAEAVAAVFRRWRFDAVLNLAARAGVRYSIDHPEVYVTTNLLGSLHLLRAMVAHGVPKYVLASSSSLYAGLSPPFVETADVSHPISPYAASKLAAEAMAHVYHHLNGIDVSVLRYFTVYGPAGRPDMSPLRFIRWIDEGTPIQVFGDGEQGRDFTYVDDIAAGTVAALRPVGYAVINLGGGNAPLTLNRMIAEFERLLGRRAVIDRRPEHPGDMRDTQADVSRAAALLDWRPTVAPADGFARTVAWYQENRDWMRDIRL